MAQAEQMNRRGRGTRDAVVLLSGGLDSATLLAVAISCGHRCHALSFDYGQRHRWELKCASRIAKSGGATDHRIMHLALGELKKSALTDHSLEVPKLGPEARSGPAIPITYVPARNTIFLSYALAYAEVTCSDLVYIGVSAVDYSGYPDCRPEYVEAFAQVAALATKRAVEGTPPLIKAPLLHMSKAQVITQGLGLSVDYSLTLSCYDPDPYGRACGRCDSCRLRLKAFREAGVEDPASYR